MGKLSIETKTTFVPPSERVSAVNLGIFNMAVYRDLLALGLYCPFEELRLWALPSFALEVASCRIPTAGLCDNSKHLLT